ncbi:MAG: cytochrome C oxidase subunit IV family protein [Phycisphaerales bacterium]
MSHAAPHDATSELGWNPEDPHGTSTHAHGHVVVGWKLQIGILAALMFFTALTVGFYNAEKWAEAAFLIHLPNWVNIVGAMSIASIKATLVCMYFMQLRYDKPLNTFALLFCLFAVGLFLFFSALDLSTRGWVNDFKYGEISDNTGAGNPGGTGVGLGDPARNATFSARVSPRVLTSGMNLIDTRRAEYKVKWLEEHPGSTDKEFWAYFYSHVKHPHRKNDDTENYFAQLGYGHDANEVSTSQKQVIRTGRTNALELSDDHSAHGSDHGSDH